MTHHLHSLTVPLEGAGMRLDAYLATELESLSRSRIQQLIKEGQVLVNGLPAKASHKLEADDELECQVPEPEVLKVEPEAMDLDIVYEDEAIIVINKHQGLVVHPCAGTKTSTLVHGLMHHCQDLSGINGILRPGIVHRLDKDTSGLLVVAKHDQAHQSLAKQIQERTMKREYLALLHGQVAASQGLIDVPLARDPRDRQKMSAQASGKEARTHYELLEHLESYSSVLCRLETGRTHQIRVHMAYLGHPVAGDPKYGRRKESLAWPGQALHAWHLHLLHPATGIPMDFYAPLPSFFRGVLEDMGADKTLTLLDAHTQSSGNMLE